MTIIEKIYFRGYAGFFLQWNQYMQLLDRKALILAPYYNDRLRKQSLIVADNENFKASHGGKTQFEYENNL